MTDQKEKAPIKEQVKTQFTQSEMFEMWSNLNIARHIAETIMTEIMPNNDTLFQEKGERSCKATE